VYSEKEFIREIEKISSTLVPEKDWSVRIAALQKIEGLVLGGWCFPSSFYFSGVYVIYTYFVCSNPILSPPFFSLNG
jgi:hypothetical protein